MKRALLLAALALGACDRPADVGKTRPSTAAEEEALENIPATDAAGQAPPRIEEPYNAPEFARVYPGATILSAHATTEAGDAGGIITFVAPAEPGAVADYYRTRLHEAGFPTVSDAFANGARMISATRGQARDRIDIQIVPAPEGSRATIAYVLEDG